MTGPRGPVRDNERSPAPDLARGFMLLLIALANTPFYLWAAQTTSVSSAHPDSGSALDRVVQFVIMIMVDFRTYPMFAFLFGYGMVQLYRRQIAAGAEKKPARRLLQRRNLWLLIFGFVHAALLWMGDVLGAYGLAGLIFVALFFRRKDKTLIIWAMILVAIQAVIAVLALLGGGYLAGQPTPPGMENLTGQVHALAAMGDYLASIPARLGFWAFLVVGQGLLLMVIPTMLLLAFWAGRREVLERPGEHLRLLRRTAVIGIPIGWLGALPAALSHFGVIEVPAHASWMFTPLDSVTGLCTGLGYVALFGLIGHRVATHRDGRPSEPGRITLGYAVTAVGKRSLSCYLAQSVLCAPSLSAWGLGLGQYFGSAAMAAYAIGVWAVTVVFAVLLERAGRRGPAEVLLRRLTYRRSLATAR